MTRRCSLISVECEKLESRSVAGEDIDLELFGTLTNKLGRTLARLSLRRVPKVISPPDLQEYPRDREDASCEDAHEALLGEIGEPITYYCDVFVLGYCYFVA
jgi:hypothetical protein